MGSRQAHNRIARGCLSGGVGEGGLGQEVLLAEVIGIAAVGSTHGRNAVPIAVYISSRGGLVEGNHQVAAHVQVRRGQGDFHDVVIDGEGTGGRHLRHGGEVSDVRHGGCVGLRQVDFELGGTPVHVGIAGVESQLVDGAILHGGQTVGRNDKGALGIVIHIIAINGHIAVGGGAVIHGKRSIGRVGVNGFGEDATNHEGDIPAWIYCTEA